MFILLTWNSGSDCKIDNSAGDERSDPSYLNKILSEQTNLQKLNVLQTETSCNKAKMRLAISLTASQETVTCREKRTQMQESRRWTKSPKSSSLLLQSKKKHNSNTEWQRGTQSKQRAGTVHQKCCTQRRQPEELTAKDDSQQTDFRVNPVFSVLWRSRSLPFHCKKQPY